MNQQRWLNFFETTHLNLEGNLLKLVAWDERANCFILWYKSRSLSSHTFMRTCKNTWKQAQAFTAKMTASSRKDHQDDSGNQGSYGSNGLKLSTEQ